MLPGVAPAGRRVERPLVAVVKFRGDKHHERICRDQASVLVQVGLLDPRLLPVAGVEAAQKLLDERLPSNTLMPQWRVVSQRMVQVQSPERAEMRGSQRATADSRVGAVSLPVVLSRDEVARLIGAVTNLKHQTALTVAYGAGLRAGEVIALKVGDIDSQRMTLRVEQGKGRKDRYAMLSPLLLERLRAWWRVAHAQGKIFHKGWLFPGLDPMDPLTARQLNRAILAGANAAGIDKRVTMHSLRHAFATHLLEQKVDIRVIQVLLGHKKLETTSIYTHVATAVLREVVSPLDVLPTP